MALKRYCIIAVLVIVALLLPIGGQVGAGQGNITLTLDWMMYGGYNRTYGYYVPTGYNSSGGPVPLLFSFHGLGSNGQAQEYLTSFAELAEQEGFIAVFPYATNIPGYHPILPTWLPNYGIQWNLDGPGSMQYYYDVDDLGFVSALVDKFTADYNITRGRIYATGMSNGAMFSYFLAMKLPGVFAGIAAVTSPMTLNMWEYDFDTDVGCPVTVILIQGTHDPIVPYDGLPNVTGSVDQTIDYWKDANNITTEPVETTFDGYPNDPTKVYRYVYGGGADNTEVILYKVDLGGHTWPGSYQYAPEAVIGKTSYEINATEKIWEHFEAHSLPPLPPVRRSPKVVTPGEEFEVKISFAAPEGAFQNINLTDSAPTGWTVSVNTTWPDPDADTAQTPAANQAQYIWNGPYNNNTWFTAVYKVKVPDDAAPGNYTFSGLLRYSVGANNQEAAVRGNTRVRVVDRYTLTVNSAAGGSVTMPGTGNFTYRGGKVVYLAATPSSGYKFSQWSGDNSTVQIVGTDPKYAIITMNGNYTITAEFEKIPPTVSTTTIYSGDVGTDSANLKMSYTMGGYGSVDVRFAYKKSTDTEWSNTSWTSRSAAGTYNQTVTGLSPATTYQYKAQLRYDSIVIEGAVKQFTTAAIPGGGGGGCFIATAAYGTPTAVQLNVLREFRDAVLLKSALGSRLVDLYYKASPPIAEFISQHDVLMTVVRELLVEPIVWLLKATSVIWHS